MHSLLLGVAYALRDRVGLVDKRSDQLGGIYLSAAHFKKMAVLAEYMGRKLVLVVDLADRRKSVISEM